MISLMYRIFKSNKPIDTENRFVVPRDEGWEVEEMGDGGQKV